MRIPRTLAVFITATVATATIAVASPGTAFANDSTTTTSEVTAALDKADAKNGALVATATPSTTDGGQTITIGLPNASQGGKGAKNGKGVVAYSGRDGSANAVVLADNSGVQFLTTIESKKAPTKYDYPVTLPQGGKIEVAQQNGGGAVVYDAEGKLTALIPAPWAKDANGKDVADALHHRRQDADAARGPQDEGRAVPRRCRPGRGLAAAGHRLVRHRRKLRGSQSARPAVVHLALGSDVGLRTTVRGT